MLQGTALHSAMLSGNQEVVELLIRYRADVRAGNNEGEQPIHIAAAEDYSEIIVLLAKGGLFLCSTLLLKDMFYHC
jgi:FOG: Ankyrin repeat